ncbi:DNA mismatch repair protein [Amphichorda felina]
MSIRQLPEDVVDRLKSSVVITSLNGVVCGLLKNSLDAGAAKINITVDYSRGNCTLEDNGIGIPPEEFKEGGGLGKLHHTSRFPPNDNVYGRQGDFLASLATLSLLSVSSRHYGHVSHNSIRFHNSKNSA